MHHFLKCGDNGENVEKGKMAKIFHVKWWKPEAMASIKFCFENLAGAINSSFHHF